MERISEKDIVVHLPGSLPDTASTVIVLELKNELRTDSVRYVSSNIASTRLLAFDATLHGEGFAYGDGKTARYYVEGWKSKEQYLSWDFRTGALPRTTYRLNTLQGGKRGRYQLVVDGQAWQEKEVTIKKGVGEVITEEVGVLSLGADCIHEYKTGSDSKNSLMKPLEVQLINEKK